MYGLAGRKGLTVLTGEAGTGKTTLLTVALAQWREAGHLVATLRNPTMDRRGVPAVPAARVRAERRGRGSPRRRCCASSRRCCGSGTPMAC